MSLEENESDLIAGTMTWGSWGRKLSIDQMSSLIEEAFKAGINMFDLADIYGDYTTEAEFGKAFAQTGIEREDVEFITKCGIMRPCANRDYRITHYDYGAQHISDSVQNSLDHLQTDYLDLLLFHRPSPLMGNFEAGYTIKSFLEDGVISNFGVSNFSNSTIAYLQCVEAFPQFNQIELSLTNPKAMLDGTLEYLESQSIFVQAYSPLGTYFKVQDKKTYRIRKVLNRLCRKYKCKESQLLLAWVRNHPVTIYPVIGTTRIERMKDLIEAEDLIIDTEDWFELLEASTGQRVP